MRTHTQSCSSVANECDTTLDERLLGIALTCFVIDLNALPPFDLSLMQRVFEVEGFALPLSTWGPVTTPKNSNAIGGYSALAKSRSRGGFAALSCFSGLLLCLSLEPRPLFYGDQNTYLLHGLAAAGYGALAQDWLASTRSPMPVFDALVALAWRYLGSTGLYLLHLTLFIALAGALLLLLRSSRLGIGWGWVGPLTVLAVMAAIWGWAQPLPILSQVTRDGFAVQTIVPDKFTPSSFGVFLLVSLALFANHRPVFASAAAALASLIHPTYLIASSVLALVYALTAIIMERRTVAALGILITYLVLISPIVVFLLIEFSPSTLETSSRAAEILAYQRDPHHALPQVWFNREAAIKIAVIVLGIAIWTQSHRRLAYALAAASGAMC